MSDLPEEFDLKFLPDWLKEAPSENRYANYEGDTGDRGHGERRGGGGQRDDRRPPRNDRRPGGDRRGPGNPQRPGGPQRPGERRGPQPGRPQGGRPGGGGPRDQRRHDDRREDSRAPREPRPQAAPQPAQLRVEFLPEPLAAAGIAKQVKGSGRAYGVFSIAKLFLERPERHRVRVTSADANVPLYQIGEGPISFDRAAIERSAFQAAKAEYYREEVTQGEPIKGNFSNVARSRTTGVLLAPTNHHAYQPALRKLYDERFSRRMSYPQFLAQEIEVLNNEQAVADWKEQARSKTTYVTLKETEPVTFDSLSAVEQHFRQHYLPQLVKSGTSLECTGNASRSAVDRHVAAAVRDTWEKERPFPQQIVNQLRPHFMDAGLHFFKHRKRLLFVSAHRPARHLPNQVFSDGIASILTAVSENPRIKRPALATKLLGAQHDSPEMAPRKVALAGDLHYLLGVGHVIEFADGALELPLSPKAIEEPAARASVAVDDTAADERSERESVAEAAPTQVSQPVAPAQADSNSPHVVEIPVHAETLAPLRPVEVVAAADAVAPLQPHTTE